MWFYLHSESNLWTVGFYNPNGKWQPESDHESPEGAAARVHYLNGGGECGQSERDARILAENNIELLKALEGL
jgi:hypothetical protein